MMSDEQIVAKRNDRRTLPASMENGVEETMNQIVEVKDEATFRKLLGSKQPVVVDYWASWCRPCIGMKPIFHKLAARHYKIARFASVDVEKHPALAKGVKLIPTFTVQILGREKRNEKKKGERVGLSSEFCYAFLVAVVSLVVGMILAATK